MWKDLNAAGVAKALRGIVGDVAIRDRELLRKVDAPVLIIGREGDPIHPAEVSRVLAEIFPNAEMILLSDEEELVASIPMLVDRVGSFLTGAG
jgi:pimeloyl-ACP methyl ester carboxylesterase